MCQVMGILMKTASDAWPTRPWIPYGWYWCVTACPEGKQARTMVGRFHPVCDTLAALCILGSSEAFELRFVSPSKFTHVLYGGRYAGLAFVQGSIAPG